MISESRMHFKRNQLERLERQYLSTGTRKTSKGEQNLKPAPQNVNGE